VAGAAALWERLPGGDGGDGGDSGGGDVLACYHPGSFMQANPRAYGRMLHAAAQWVPPGAQVVELYAGVGTIGMSLAAAGRAASVRCVEVCTCLSCHYALTREPPVSARWRSVS